MTVAVDVYRVMAACTSTLMLLSPIPMIYNIYKTKSTGVMSIVPLVSMLANSHSAIFYGYLTEHYFPIFSTFVVGDILCITYITIFYIYSHEKSKAHKVFLAYGIPLTLITIYGFIGGFGVTGQTRYQAGNVFGYVSIVTNLLLYSAPFEKVALVLKHKSAVFINIHMVCAGTFNNMTWITYSALTRQWLIFAPNVFCCTMGCTQIVLYLIFHPRTHPYHGPMPGVAIDPVLEIDIELGDMFASPKTQAKAMTTPVSPLFVPLESPLEPIQPPRTKQNGYV